MVPHGWADSNQGFAVKSVDVSSVAWMRIDNRFRAEGAGGGKASINYIKTECGWKIYIVSYDWRVGRWLCMKSSLDVPILPDEAHQCQSEPHLCSADVLLIDALLMCFVSRLCIFVALCSVDVLFMFC